MRRTYHVTLHHVASPFTDRICWTDTSPPNSTQTSESGHTFVTVLTQSSNQDSPRRRSDASCGSSYTQSESVDSVIGTSAPVQAPSAAEIAYIPEISILSQQYLNQTSINSPRYNEIFYNQPSDSISYSSFPSSDVL